MIRSVVAGVHGLRLYFDSNNNNISKSSTTITTAQNSLKLHLKRAPLIDMEAFFPSDLKCLFRSPWFKQHLDITKMIDYILSNNLAPTKSKKIAHIIPGEKAIVLR